MNNILGLIVLGEFIVAGTYRKLRNTSLEVKFSQRLYDISTIISLKLDGFVPIIDWVIKVKLDRVLIPVSNIKVNI